MVEDIKLIPNQKLAPSSELTRKFHRKFFSICSWAVGVLAVAIVMEWAMKFRGRRWLDEFSQNLHCTHFALGVNLVAEVISIPASNLKIGR